MSSKRPSSGLGRGLSALLDEAVRPTPAPSDDGGETTAVPGGTREVDIARIRPNPNQPRIQFDEEAIAELADSIGERGVLQPILVRPAGDEFQIVAGERRWRAAQRARLHTVPVIIRDIDDAVAAEIALIENIQREDLNAIEEAEGYRQLIDRHGHTQDKVGKLVHKSRSHVTNLLRLLDLPPEAKESLLRGDISMGHARAALSASDPDDLVRQIVAGGLSVRQAEALAKREKPGAGSDIARASSRNRSVDPDVAALERQLADLLGVKVKVDSNGTKGTLTLHFSSLDQLDMICQRLSGEPI